MNVKAFLVTALSSALDLGLATGDDVLRHVTPEVLAAHLPRPLWARLLTACVGASRVDSQLVIETVGVPNLCEHVPAALLWACVAEIGARTLGGALPVPVSQPALLAPSPAAALLAPVPVTTVSPPLAVGPSIPTPGAALDLEEERQPSPVSGRARSASRSGFRQSSTGSGIAGRPTNGATERPTPPPQPRRPQASATSPSSVIEAGTSRARRPATDVSDYEIETDVRVGDDWRATLAPNAGNAVAVEVDVDDEQLVDWAASEETVTGGDGIDRKR